MKTSLIFLGAILCLGSYSQSQSVGRRETPYEHWLIEDAAYIITDHEAAQYTFLKTDADRNQFITEFWLRRDPTPGTVVNEYKEEHYRRLAYANEHFAEGKPGWKTDRGRIYIVDGPPDHVIHRQLATGEQAEDWIWDGPAPNRQVLFENITQQSARRITFIDNCKCGHFQLQSNVTDK